MRTTLALLAYAVLVLLGLVNWIALVLGAILVLFKFTGVGDVGDWTWSRVLTPWIYLLCYATLNVAVRLVVGIKNLRADSRSQRRAKPETGLAELMRRWRAWRFARSQAKYDK